MSNSITRRLGWTRVLIGICDIVLAVSAVYAAHKFLPSFQGGLGWREYALAALSFFSVSCIVSYDIHKWMRQSSVLLHFAFWSSLSFVLLFAFVSSFFYGQILPKRCVLALFALLWCGLVVAHLIIKCFLDRQKQEVDGTAVALSALMWELSERQKPLEHLAGKVIKRVFDVVLSAALLLTVFPLVYIFAAITVKVQKRGAVLLVRRMRDWNGKTFSVLQLNLAGSSGQRKAVTESPMLMNVLLGKLSFVGAPLFSLEADAEDAKPADTIKSGLIRTPDVAWYAMNWSVWLDLCLILKAMRGGETVSEEIKRITDNI